MNSGAENIKDQTNGMVKFKDKGKKKVTLKGKLIFVVILICVVQLLFMTAGCIFVFGGINDRSKRHIENAFFTTVDFVDSIEAYTDKVAATLSSEVNFNYITQDSFKLEPLKSNTEMDRAYNMLQMIVADSKLTEAGLYFPVEYIYHLRIRGFI